MKKHLFYGLVITIAVLFAACFDDDDAASKETEIFDSSPRYSISVIPEKREASGVIVVNNADGIVTTSPSGMVKAGTTVTISARPELIDAADNDDTSGGGGDEQVYWFVKSISGSYSLDGVPGKNSVSFHPSSSENNEWTFKMMPGDLVITIDFTTEADENTAFLDSLYASNGVISPDFARDNYDYTIAVPSGTKEFSISAQAENPYLEPELRQVSPESGVKELDDDLTLTEGLNEYTITVTSQDEKTKKEYRIKAIKRPDLTLQTFKITNNTDNFERELVPQAMQDVYVPYRGGLLIEVNTNDSYASISQSPPTVPVLSEYINVPAAVTVTVSKSLSGVAAEYTTKSYALNLHYIADMDLTPLAEGGYVGFIPAETPGAYYEVHTFLKSDALSFFDKSTTSIKADYLIVAGGGGGVQNWWGSSGGALYKTGETLTPAGASISVTVGEGGNGGSNSADGGNGAASSIGAVAVPGGGGGGSGQTPNSPRPGISGGSGGGGSAGFESYGSGGASTAANGIMGHRGGNGIDNMLGGGGGGGGGGAGAPWVPAGEAEWLISVAGSEFSRGGNGSGISDAGKGADGQNYGNGGSGGGKYGSGGAGHSGIVIIRFPYSGNTHQ
jgi:hypothetical protein